MPTLTRNPAGTSAARRRPPGGRALISAALVGVVAAMVFLGTAEVLAFLFSPASAPLTSTGQAVIVVVPQALAEAAISALGTADKPVLLGSVLAGGLLAAAGLGILASRRARLGLLAFLATGLGVAALVVTRPAATLWDGVPTLAGLGLGILTLHVLSRAAPRHDQRPPDGPDGGDSTGGRDGGETPLADDRNAPALPLSRRGFLTLTAAAAAIGTASLAAGRSVAAITTSAASRAAELILPAPAAAAAPIPASAQVGVDGVPPFITPAVDLYRIDTALAPPEPDPETWTLRIHGLVAEEVTVTMDDVLAAPLEEHHITLTCVSNPVGGDLLGTGTWLGLPVRELLALARPLPEADMVLSHSIDGFTASTPLEALTDDRPALLAVGMNGEPLLPEHGFPARLVVPGLYGFVSATKWVTELEVTRFDRAEAYWTQRGWDAKAPILPSSRVDVPGPLAEVPAGTVVTAGSAWAQQSGVSAVEVRLDDGDWVDADLGADVDTATWRQWRCEFDSVEVGLHAVTVRAIDAEGSTQTADRRDPIPNSATGHHRIQFRVV